MRLVSYARYLVVVLLFVGGTLPQKALSDDPKKDAKPAQDDPLSKFVYPSAKAYGQKWKGKDVPTEVAKYTTKDDVEKVVKWYKENMTPTPNTIPATSVDGVGHRRRGDRPTKETAWAVHDYQYVGDNLKDPRPVVVWVATARVSTDKVEDYTLNVVVTRGKDEALTHIALSFFPGSQPGKK
jgi:hypothetical protein